MNAFESPGNINSTQKIHDLQRRPEHLQCVFTSNLLNDPCGPLTCRQRPLAPAKTHPWRAISTQFLVECVTCHHNNFALQAVNIILVPALAVVHACKPLKRAFKGFVKAIWRLQRFWKDPLNIVWRPFKGFVEAC